jgi:hypothetical protein
MSDIHGAALIDRIKNLSGRFLVMSYEQAMDLLTRDDRFKATVYAMNTLLIQKGIYTQEEFQELFIEWASKQSKNSIQEISRDAVSA